MAAAEVMVGWPDPDLLAASALELLLLPSAGYEEYLTPELAAREGLVVCNAGGAYSEGVAEHCVAMMLALVRRLPRIHHGHAPARLGPSAPARPAVGLDRVRDRAGGPWGRPLPGGARALGMRVVGVRRRPDRPCPNVSEVFGPEALAAAVAGADHVVGALPGGGGHQRADQPGGDRGHEAGRLFLQRRPGGRPSTRRPWWSGWPAGAWPGPVSTCSPPSRCRMTARCGAWRM